MASIGERSGETILSAAVEEMKAGAQLLNGKGKVTDGQVHLLAVQFLLFGLAQTRHAIDVEPAPGEVFHVVRAEIEMTVGVERHKAEALGEEAEGGRLHQYRTRLKKEETTLGGRQSGRRDGILLFYEREREGKGAVVAENLR